MNMYEPPTGFVSIPDVYYIIDDSENKANPMLISSIRVFKDMHVEIYNKNIG